MSDYELIQQRNISGKGVLKVPTDTVKNRAYILYTSVIREPKNSYLNLNYNPGKSRYGTLVFLRDDYVISTLSIDFKKQVFDGVNDVSGQTLLAVKCAYDGMLESVLRLSVAIAGTPGGAGMSPINYTNLIADYTNLRLAWNECRLVCYADTAIQLNLYRLKYDVCNPDFDADMPAPVPDEPPQISPGQPIEGIDGAYDDSNDGGNTVPYPGDAVPPPPPPQPCVTVIRGGGLNVSTCGLFANVGDYPYNGYAELKPTVFQNCNGLQVYVDGVSLGLDQIYHTSAIILSRTGNCIPPNVA